MEQAEDTTAGNGTRKQPFDCAVISLARTPQRLEAFLACNGRLSLDFSVFEAVDGRNLERRRLIEQGVAATDVNHWGMGSVGSAMSHRALWRQAIASQRPTCILEDDVVLRHDFSERVAELFPQLPPDWDLVLLGYNTDSVLDVQVVPGCDLRGHFTLPRPLPEDCDNFVRSSAPIAPVRLNNAFGLCAYLVSPRGAQLLEDRLIPLTQRAPLVPALGCVVAAATLDGNMNDLYRGIGAYACLPPIALPINDKQSSTIYPETGNGSSAPNSFAKPFRLRVGRWLRRIAAMCLRAARF